MLDEKGLLCLVSANVIAIHHEKGYHYVGCKKCKRMVRDKSCEKCKEKDAAVPYYTFKMKISGGTESVWVHVFGDQSDLILGKNAKEVIQMQETDEIGFKKLFDKPKGMVCKCPYTHRPIRCW